MTTHKTKLDGCASLRISWKAIKCLSSRDVAIKGIIRAELLSSVLEMNAMFIKH